MYVYILTVLLCTVKMYNTQYTYTCCSAAQSFLLKFSVLLFLCSEVGGHEHPNILLNHNSIVCLVAYLPRYCNNNGLYKWINYFIFMHNASVHTQILTWIYSTAEFKLTCVCGYICTCIYLAHLST